MRLFGLEIRRQKVAPDPTEPPAPPRPLPDLWSGLDLDEKVAPSWPKIYASPIWQRELLPWFEALRNLTYKMLRDEDDPARSQALRVRILLLEGLIEQPEIEHNNLKRLLDNRYRAGEDPDELRA